MQKYSKGDSLQIVNVNLTKGTEQTACEFLRISGDSVTYTPTFGQAEGITIDEVETAKELPLLAETVVYLNGVDMPMLEDTLGNRWMAFTLSDEEE